jgi:hypothetical protein
VSCLAENRLWSEPLFLVCVHIAKMLETSTTMVLTRTLYHVPCRQVNFLLRPAELQISGLLQEQPGKGDGESSASQRHLRQTPKKMLETSTTIVLTRALYHVPCRHMNFLLRPAELQISGLLQEQSMRRATNLDPGVKLAQSLLMSIADKNTPSQK